MGWQFLLLLRVRPEEGNQADERSTQEPGPGLRLLQAPYCPTFNPRLSLGLALPRRAPGGGRAEQPERRGPTNAPRL